MIEENEFVKFESKLNGNTPKRILIIRLQATGDVIIMLPYIQSLRAKLPSNVIIDLLVREECKGIPEELNLFDNVFVLKGGRNTKLQLMHFLFSFWLKLKSKQYDALFDLQNHNLSAVIRGLLGVSTYSIFDRSSTDFAGDRYKNTINSLEIAKVDFEKLNCFKVKDRKLVLKKFGLSENQNYIVLNPAGAFENRNLEIEKYIAFAKLWLKEIDSSSLFLIIGIDKIKEKSELLKSALGDKLINLVSKTSQIEALQILRSAQLVVSEDSGLFHMSYVIGIPTIGIFGSTRNDWTNPYLPHTFCFNSNDLDCGNCMLEKCKFNQIKCIERITAESILSESCKLLKNNT